MSKPRAPKHYKTIKRTRFFAITRPKCFDIRNVVSGLCLFETLAKLSKGNVNPVSETGEYLYYTTENTFEPFGCKTKCYPEPTEASVVAKNLGGNCEVHLFENFVKQWIIS